MATFKRNKKWYIKGRIQKEDGTYYQYTKLARGCKYVDEAREYETEFVKQWQAIQVAKYNKTFAELAVEYLAQAVNVKAVTIRTDQDIIDKCNKAFGKKKINLFNKEYLQKFIKGLEEKYSKSYVSKYYYTINKIFKYAVDEDYIVINPMTKVRRSAFKDEVKKEMLFWEPSEFETFIQYVKNPEMMRFYIFLYYMGTRKGEAQALQWKDISFENNTITIYKTVTNKIKGKAWEITSPKTQNSMRTIIMPDVVKAAILEQKACCEKLYGYNTDCFVFGFDRPLPSETIRKNLIRGVESANADGNPLQLIRVHDLRHSHVSYLINNKADQYSDYEIAQRLGDTVETIRKTYAHLFKDADRKIIEFMNKDTRMAETASEQPKINKYEELKELKELHDLDIITPEEFTKKKKQLLGI